MMPNYRNLVLRFLLVAFFLLIAVILFATLYPFNFSPANGVQWLSNEPGLYFNGYGIAYTERDKSVCETKAVSVELWLRERFGSKNWGPREIFSFYDGSASPSLLVGQWGRRIFLYSRFEKNEGDKWYRLFRAKSYFPRGKPHLVTVTFGEGVKAIYIDGELNDKRRTEIHAAPNIVFSGSLVLGNAPTAGDGWWGEVKGLAIYNRVLLPAEIIRHSSEVFQKGMRGLAETPGCLALYPFDEGEGITAKSIVGKSRHFSIPASQTPLDFATIFNLPHENMRSESRAVENYLRNILLFFPYGILFSAIILRKYTIGYFVTFLIVILAGGLLSFAIEFLQLFLPTRASGIADVLANMVGSGLGVLVVCSLKLKK
jgi:VanZ family protein